MTALAELKAEKNYRGPCPCGSRQSYEKCCQNWHSGQLPPDAGTLMRSRYSAFVLNLEDYLLRTWHPDTRPEALNLASSKRRWLGLKVLQHESETAGAATVAFVARYKASGRAHELRETSRFVCENGRWLYVDGEIAGAQD